MPNHAHGEHKKEGKCDCETCCEVCQCVPEGGFLGSFSPKGAFFLGLGASLVVFFVVGFFVLLGVVMKKGTIGSVAGTKTSAPTEQANPSPSAPAPSYVPPAPNADGMKAVSDEDWMRGSVNAPVTVVEYSDYECPFCKRHHDTMKQLIAEYEGKVNWVYRHFPLDMHPKAYKEAEAAECAGELGGNTAFWKFTDRIFEVSPLNNGLDPAQLPVIAEYAGVNVDQFNECLNSGKYAQKIQESVQDAATAGGNGTPHNVIVSGDQKVIIVGADTIERFKAEIDKLL